MNTRNSYKNVRDLTTQYDAAESPPRKRITMQVEVIVAIFFPTHTNVEALWAHAFISVVLSYMSPMVNIRQNNNCDEERWEIMLRFYVITKKTREAVLSWVSYSVRTLRFVLSRNYYLLLLNKKQRKKRWEIMFSFYVITKRTREAVLSWVSNRHWVSFHQGWWDDKNTTLSYAV